MTDKDSLQPWLSSEELRATGRPARLTSFATLAMAAIVAFALIVSLDREPIFIGIGSGLLVATLALTLVAQKEWRLFAGTVDTEPVEVHHGTITEIRPIRGGRVIKADIDSRPESEWRLIARDPDDVWSLSGDTISVQIYGRTGKVVAAVRNEKTKRISPSWVKLDGT